MYLHKCQQPQQDGEASKGGGEGTNVLTGEQEKTKTESRVFPGKWQNCWSKWSDDKNIRLRLKILGLKSESDTHKLSNCGQVTQLLILG